MPVGSYIPQFFRVEVLEEKPVALSGKLPTFDHEFDPESLLSVPPRISQDQVVVARVSRRRTIAALLAGITVGVLAAVLGFVSYPIVVAHHQAKTPVMQIWGPS